MRLGTKIKELRKKKGLTQIELSERTGLTERTIQRIENHEVEPSKHSLKEIGNVLNYNLIEQKFDDMTKKQRLLNIFIISISILIVVEFFIGWLTWDEHWWVLISWFFPILGGVSIPYYKKRKGK
jgi:transcriptional regulator with XRE-family HTH domain